MTRMWVVIIAVVLAAPSLTTAQPLGTFRWQLQPFCNVVTLAVTQNGSVYRVEGTDDQCGNGADQASAIGTAFQNPDGSIGIGLSIVASPSATPVNVDAAISIATLSGTWRDTAGNSGAFTFTPGAGNGGNPRPFPASPAGGDVTGVIAGTGLTGGGLGGDIALAVDNTVVQSRVSGACAAGQAVRAVNQNGTVACESIAAAAVPPAIQLRADGGLVASGIQGIGTIPASGPGTRMMWYPAKGAFRAGGALSDEWDLTNLGSYSVAFGYNNVASGDYSTAFGTGVRATGAASTAMGHSAVASGDYSTAFGAGVRASGGASTALGNGVASGEGSTAMGFSTEAVGHYSTAMGVDTLASGLSSVAMGQNTSASGWASTAMGIESTAGGRFSLAAGDRVSAAGEASVALGAHVSATTRGTFAFGDTSTTTPMQAFTPNQFLVRAAGGTGFYSSAGLSTGVLLLPGANAWSSASDSRIKTAYRELSHDDVLDKIAQMAVTEWSYIAQGESIRHIGPTAQDFYVAFGLGEDPLRISTLDADGVALAAIRALEARTRDQTSRIAALEDELVSLRALVSGLARRPQ